MNVLKNVLNQEGSKKRERPRTVDEGKSTIDDDDGDSIISGHQSWVPSSPVRIYHRPLL